MESVGRSFAAAWIDDGYEPGGGETDEKLDLSGQRSITSGSYRDGALLITATDAACGPEDAYLRGVRSRGS